MTALRTSMRRAITVGVAAVLCTMAMATTGVGATPDATPTDDVGVQAVKYSYFSGFGCSYQGVSGVDGSLGTFAATATTRGSNCPNAMVRAYVCSSGSCWTTEWRSARVAEIYFPESYRLVTSYHKCSGCTLTHRINH